MRVIDKEKLTTTSLGFSVICLLAFLWGFDVDIDRCITAVLSVWIIYYLLGEPIGDFQ